MMTDIPQRFPDAAREIVNGWGITAPRGALCYPETLSEEIATFGARMFNEGVAAAAAVIRPCDCDSGWTSRGRHAPECCEEIREDILALRVGSGE
jgi:hypothetical protein